MVCKAIFLTTFGDAKSVLYSMLVFRIKKNDIENDASHASFPIPAGAVAKTTKRDPAGKYLMRTRGIQPVCLPVSMFLSYLLLHLLIDGPSPGKNQDMTSLRL